MSPTLKERYLAAAQKVGRLAVGTPTPAPNIDFFRIADDLSQAEQIPGLPFARSAGAAAGGPGFGGGPERRTPGPANQAPQRPGISQIQQTGRAGARERQARN